MLSLNHHRLHIETMIMMADTCPIRYVANANEVEFTIGDPDESFELSATVGALDNLIAVATEAREAARNHGAR
ncbi:MAG TPA: hypothetical protein VGG05_17845 [Pseudonocardiaceae bacterium]